MAIQPLAPLVTPPTQATPEAQWPDMADTFATDQARWTEEFNSRTLSELNAVIAETGGNADRAEAAAGTVGGVVAAAEAAAAESVSASASAIAARNAAQGFSAAAQGYSEHSEEQAGLAQEAADRAQAIVGPVGTAVSRDVTTSSQDVTPGRVLAVGNYGLPTNELYQALPLPSDTDSTTDFNSITDQGWYARLLGGASGSRNENHPDGQTALAAGNGVSNYYWVFVTKFGGNVFQWAVPYLSGADTTGVAPRFRSLGGGVWTPWRVVASSGNPTVSRRAIEWWAGADKIVSVAAATGAVSIDLAAASVFSLTLTGNTTLAPTNLPVLAGETRSIVIRVTQDSTPRLLTWWTGITWLAVVTPSAPPANKIQEYVLTWDGTSWMGRKGAGN